MAVEVGVLQSHTRVDLHRGEHGNPLDRSWEKEYERLHLLLRMN